MRLGYILYIRKSRLGYTFYIQVNPVLDMLKIDMMKLIQIETFFQNQYFPFHFPDMGLAI